MGEETLPKRADKSKLEEPKRRLSESIPSMVSIGLLEERLDRVQAHFLKNTVDCSFFFSVKNKTSYDSLEPSYLEICLKCKNVETL